MLLTLAPALTLDETILVGNWAEGKSVLGVQMALRSVHGVPNALVMPISAKDQLSPDQIMNTRWRFHCMFDMLVAAAGGSGETQDPTYPPVQMPAPLLAQHILEVPDVVHQYNPLLRVTDEVLGFYDKWYKGCRFVILPFSNVEMAYMYPFIIRFTPIDQDNLLIPCPVYAGGDVPLPEIRLNYHTELLLAPSSTVGKEVTYRDGVDETLYRWLPRRVMNQTVGGLRSAHSLVANRNDMVQGRFGVRWHFFPFRSGLLWSALMGAGFYREARGGGK